MAKWVFLLGQFGKALPGQESSSYYRGFLMGANGLNDYFRAISAGHHNLDGTVVRGFYPLTVTQAELNAIGGENARSARIEAILKDIVKLDQQSGEVFPYWEYEGVVVVLNAPINEGDSTRVTFTSGDRTVSCAATLITGTTDLIHLAHEMAHGIDLPHSRHELVLDDYGDPWDVMSARACHSFARGAYGQSGPLANVPNMLAKAWLSADRIWTFGTSPAGASAMVTLRALGHHQSPGFLSARAGDYTVELRHKSGWDKGIPRTAVLLHRIIDGRSYLISTAPELLPGRIWHDVEQDLVIGVGSLDDPGRSARVFVRRRGQPGWYRCGACNAVYFSASGPIIPLGAAARLGEPIRELPRSCMAGGAHTPKEPAGYVLVQNESADPGQPGWRHCVKCHTLFHGGDPGKGACPTDGKGHDPAGSGDYRLIQNAPDTPGEAGFRWCSQCQGLFHPDGEGGPCPRGGGAHVHGGSGNYVLTPARRRSEPVHGFWRCVRCHCLYQNTGVRPEDGGTCSDGGSHRAETAGTALAHFTLWTAGDLEPGETGWQWCAGCQCVLRAPTGHRCHGTNDHQLRGPLLRVPFIAPTSLGFPADPHWSRCIKCGGLFRWREGTGVCREGGAHDGTGSADYAVLRSVPSDRDFRSCSRCRTLFFEVGSIGTEAGYCPDGQRHQGRDSPDYRIWRDTVVVPGQRGFRRCGRCQALYFGRPDAGGLCSAPGGGAHVPHSAHVYTVCQSKTSPYESHIREGFRWCSSCDVLFALGGSSRCVGTGGGHVVGATEYFLSALDNPRG